MDVLVMTSLWEGLPRVVPQALATGIPVVSYDISGIDECISEGANGHLVPAGAVDAMVDRLADLARDAPLRGAMAKRAVLGFDPSFSEDSMIGGLEELYEELARPRDDQRSRPGRPAAGPAGKEGIR
jgi:glycosyltransferase involved in cell wall biosynthesis